MVVVVSDIPEEPTFIVDAFLTKWPTHDDRWGVTVEYSDGKKHAYSVGDRKAATAELMARLREADAEDLLRRVRRELG